MKRETALIAGLCVLLIIGCVLAYNLGAEMEKLTTQRTLQAYETHSATNPAPFDRRRRPICKPDSAVKE
jgi:hypothetical protein